MNLDYNSFLSFSSVYLVTVHDTQLGLEIFFKEYCPPIFVILLFFLAKLILNLISYLYIAVKFYKLLCYAKITGEWFPMLNPYVWPLSFIRAMTMPYFQFWSKLLPTLKFQKSSVEISGIIALEALNSLLYFCVHFVNALIIILKATEIISAA